MVSSGRRRRKGNTALLYAIWSYFSGFCFSPFQQFINQVWPIKNTKLSGTSHLYIFRSQITYPLIIDDAMCSRAFRFRPIYFRTVEIYSTFAVCIYRESLIVSRRDLQRNAFVLENFQISPLY